jgi:hypothetical protein
MQVCFGVLPHILLARSKWCHSELTPPLAFLALAPTLIFFNVRYLILILLYSILSASSYYNVPQISFCCAALKSLWLIWICVFSNTIIRRSVKSSSHITPWIKWTWLYVSVIGGNGTTGESIVLLPCVGSRVPSLLSHPLALLVSISIHTCRKIKRPLYNVTIIVGKT